MIPQEIIGEYELMENHIDGFLYFRVEKGMYGIFQYSIITHTVLKVHPLTFGYSPAPIIPVIWRHKTNVILFTLVVYNFGIKNQSKEDLQHIINGPKEKYEVNQDWTGELYSGITLK